jgi:hypothetical protein
MYACSVTALLYTRQGHWPSRIVLATKTMTATKSVSTVPCRPQLDHDRYKNQAMQACKDIADFDGPLQRQRRSSTELNIWGPVPTA